MLFIYLFIYLFSDKLMTAFSFFVNVIVLIEYKLNSTIRSMLSL